MAGFTKLFSSIIDSTIWREPDHIRLVWITMLAKANRHGIVECALPNLADISRVKFAQCEEAINLFLAPDPHSRSKDFEGRRIMETDGGWILLNYQKYRKIQDEGEKRAKTAERVRKHREKFANVTPLVTDVTDVTLVTLCNAIAEAEAEAEGEGERKKEPFFSSFSDLEPQPNPKPPERVAEHPADGPLTPPAAPPRRANWRPCGDVHKKILMAPRCGNIVWGGNPGVTNRTQDTVDLWVDQRGGGKEAIDAVAIMFIAQHSRTGRQSMAQLASEISDGLKAGAGKVLIPAPEKPPAPVKHIEIQGSVTNRRATP